MIGARASRACYAQREFRRFYPDGEVMAHVLGFTNIDDRGQEGLELAFDDWLTGKPGREARDPRPPRPHRRERGPGPRRRSRASDLRAVASTAASSTWPIANCADAMIEHRRQQRLGRWCSTCATGEILAMVNLPVLQPECARRHRAADAQRNRAVTDVLEPGSMIKPFTVAAGAGERQVHARHR